MGEKKKIKIQVQHMPCDLRHLSSAAAARRKQCISKKPPKAGRFMGVYIVLKDE